MYLCVWVREKREKGRGEYRVVGEDELVDVILES